MFYWVALASGSVTADNVMKHGANNGVILGDVLLSRVPFVSYHFQVCAYTLVELLEADAYLCCRIMSGVYILDLSRPVSSISLLTRCQHLMLPCNLSLNAALSTTAVVRDWWTAYDGWV